MSFYQGYKGKVAIGLVKIAELTKYGLPGMASTLVEKSSFGDAFEEFVYGLAKGGQVNFSGWFDAEDTTGQDVLIAAYQNKTNVNTLRVYYGSSDSQFFHLMPGASLYVTDLSIGDADVTGLIPISFQLDASGGGFQKVSGYYSGIDVSFTHTAGANNDTVNKTGGTSFVGLGFLAGHDLIIEGSTDNDDAYTIYNVAANALTLSDDTIVTEIAGDTVSLISMA